MASPREIPPTIGQTFSRGRGSPSACSCGLWGCSVWCPSSRGPFVSRSYHRTETVAIIKAFAETSRKRGTEKETAVRLRDRLSLKTLFRQSDWTPPHPPPTHPSLHTHTHTDTLTPHTTLYPNCQKLSTSKRAILIGDSNPLAPHQAALMVLEQDLLSSAKQQKAKDGARSAFGATNKLQWFEKRGNCRCLTAPRARICHKYFYVYSVTIKKDVIGVRDLRRGGRVIAKFSFRGQCCSPSFVPLLVRNGETPQPSALVCCCLFCLKS